MDYDLFELYVYILKYKFKVSKFNPYYTAKMSEVILNYSDLKYYTKRIVLYSG